MHTEHGWYKILSEGWIYCNNTGNITVLPGTIMHSDDTGSCYNDIMHFAIVTAQASTETLSVDMSADSTADEIILQKYISNGSKIDDTRKAQQRHQQSQKLLHKSILTAQQEMIDLTNWAESIDTRKEGPDWIMLTACVVFVLVGLGSLAWLGWLLNKKLGKLGCTVINE
jgi:ribosomal protein S18